ncbi:hypothetical protein CCH79_00021124, partial [Gambusia affinis]
MAFEARLDFDAIAKEKQRSRNLQQCLTKKDRQINELLKEQAKRRRSFSPLKRENVALNAEIAVLMENKRKDENHIKELTEQLSKIKTEVIMERLQQEDLKEKVTHLPPIASNVQAPKPKSSFNQRTLRLGEAKIAPDFK